MTISSSSSSNSSSLRSRSNSASKSCLLAKDTSCRNIIYQSLRLLLQSHRWLYLCEPSTPTQSWITVPGCDSQVFKTASFFACLVGRTYRIYRHVLGLNLDLAHNALVSQRIRVRYIRSLRVATRQIQPHFPLMGCQSSRSGPHKSTSNSRFICISRSAKE